MCPRFARAIRAADLSLLTDAYEVVRPIHVESHARPDSGRPYLPNSDSATIRVPVSPATRLRDTTWVATDTGSSHVVTFRWLGRSSGDAQILDDTGAPALYATLGKPYDTWPTATGHVSAPEVPSASGELLRSSGSGCFTLAGLPTAADSNPPGLLVDLRVTAAPRVETMPTAQLAGRCP